MWQAIRRCQWVIVLLGAVIFGAVPCQAFEFQGFGAITGQVRDNNTDADPHHGAFQIGQLDFFVSKTLGDRLDILTELVIEGDDTGAFVVDLERFQIGYIFNNLLTLRAGRFHTPLGYWNATYHHGAHLQPSIERPAFIDFEDDGGPLPVHLIGLWASGYQGFGPVILEYDFLVGNGSRVHAAHLDPNSVTDNNASKAIAYRLAIRPTLLRDGAIGFSGYYDETEIFDTAGTTLNDEVKQFILGADFSYTHAPVEVIGEYYYIRDSQRLAAPKGKYRNSLFFIQAGYTLFEKLTPYVRYEQQAVRETEDPYFSALGAVDTRRAVGGLRYDITYQSAIKLEGRHVDPKRRDDYQEYAAQWSVAF